MTEDRWYDVRANQISDILELFATLLEREGFPPNRPKRYLPNIVSWRGQEIDHTCEILAQDHGKGRILVHTCGCSRRAEAFENVISDFAYVISQRMDPCALTQQSSATKEVL
jgi:hypothetical protein